MYITILLPPGVTLRAGAVRTLLAYAARRRGGGFCGGAVCDVFPAPRGTLLIARSALSARLAPWALPYLHKYFTD